MSTAINPYIDLPLPIGARINFGFKPTPPASKAEAKIEKDEIVGEVNRALNRFAYEGATE